MSEEYVDLRRKLAKTIEECLAGGLGDDEIREIISGNTEAHEALMQECFLVARVGEMYKCFPIKGIQAKTLSDININRMHAGQNTSIEIDKIDLSQLCCRQENAPKM